jgi:hypothetical protein
MGGGDLPELKAIRAKYAIKDSVGDVLEARNWAGYAVASDFKDSPKPFVSGVSAEWTVPDLGKPGKTDVSISQWIGMGGLLRGDDNTIRVGVLSEIRAGYNQVLARIIMQPGTTKLLADVVVEGGDRVSASIAAVPDAADTWRVIFENKTKHTKFDQNLKFVSGRLTAEWVPFELPREGSGYANPPEMTKLKVGMEKCRLNVDGVSLSIDSVPHIAAMNTLQYKGLMFTPSHDIKDDAFSIKVIPFGQELHYQMMRNRTRYKTIEQW